jgi:endonuclease G
MIPQTPNHNRGIWRILELGVRNTALTNDIYVVSGTMYQDGYLTIGPGKVGVPQYVWKVVYNATNNTAIGFLFPNEAIPVADLPKYAVSVDIVESTTGINVFPKLDESVEALSVAADWPEIFK